MKKVGNAREAAPPKLPEPDASKARLLVIVWDNHKDRFNGMIAEFEEQLPKGVSHAIEWHGQKAMIGEAFLKGEAMWAWKYIEPLRPIVALPDDLQMLAEIQGVLEKQEERITGELCGRRGLGSGGSGPWEGNSTNALANVQRQAQCTAKREALVMIRTMLQLLDGR